MKRLPAIVVALCFLTSPVFSVQEAPSLTFPVSGFTLKNGLHVILAQDNSLPLVTVAIAYRVGSINESRGKTGLAHMLENLMFQGSRHIAPMQHVSFIHKIGGTMNAATTEDKTLFYQTIPSHQLVLALWLEADRMMSLRLESSSIIRVKQSLLDEIRNRKERDPFLACSLYFDRMLFPDESYHHPVFGKESDIRMVTIEDARRFYSQYYGPNNAVLCISGSFDDDEIIPQIKKYFETIPPIKQIPPPSISVHENPPGGREEIYEDYMIPLPGFYLGYRIASPLHEDFYPLVLIEYILLHGMSSRLQSRLIRRERSAFRLSGGIDIKKDLAAFRIFVQNNNEATKELARRSIQSELNNMRNFPIPDREFDKIKSMFIADFIKQYYTSEDKALRLINTYLLKNKIEDPSQELAKYLAVTPATIVGIMNRYFGRDQFSLDLKRK